jgi:hypothetical protein
MQNMTQVEAFAVLVRLMEDIPHLKESPGCLNYGLRTLFDHDMVGLHLANFQHDELLKRMCPEVKSNFEEHGVSATMYASQWYLFYLNAGS